VAIHTSAPDTVDIWYTLQDLRSHVDVSRNDSAMVQPGWEQWQTTDSARPEPYEQVVWLVTGGVVKQVILDPAIGMAAGNVDTIVSKARAMFGPPDSTIVQQNPEYDQDQATAGEYGGIVWRTSRKYVWYDRGCVDVQYMVTEFSDRLKHVVIALGVDGG
jgi:hypothetical protein